MVRCEFFGRLVSQGTVRAMLVELTTPLVQEVLCLEEACEPFTIEQFVSQLVVEAFDPSLFPWGSWGDVEGFDLFGLKPVL